MHVCFEPGPADLVYWLSRGLETLGGDRPRPTAPTDRPDRPLSTISDLCRWPATLQDVTSRRKDGSKSQQSSMGHVRAIQEAVDEHKESMPTDAKTFTI